MNINRSNFLHGFFFTFSFILLGCTPTFSQTNVEITPWGESYDQPIAMVPWTDNDFILIEKTGKVKTIDENGNQLAMILDIQDNIANDGGERGLLGIAIHPGYPDTPFIYLNHTNENNNTAVVRYVFDPESTSIDPSTRKVLLTVDQPYSNHNGGDIMFGPDGYLYIGMGDGGSGGDPENRAQNLNSLLGKMLRIDVDSGENYGIPEDNPFVNNPEARNEIWSYGWRNPWRFSFDRISGDMWVGDVGQNEVEEISYEQADTTGGLNYGWRCYEGDESYDQSGNCEGPFVGPVITRTHSQGDRSITGGYRYRGPVEGFDHHYFFADYVSGNIYMAILDEQDGPVLDTLLTIGNKNSIASFAEDKEGNLFALSLSGQIYKIELSCESPQVPELMEQPTEGDSIGLITDSTYNQYLWYFSEDSEQKVDFIIVDTTESPILFTQQNGNYFVRVVDESGCQSESEILSVVLSATEAIDFYDIKIFPNPTSDYLTIKTDKVLTNATIEIRNSKGQLIKDLQTSLPGSVLLQNLPVGMYFIKFIVGQKYFVTKVMKE